MMYLYILFVLIILTYLIKKYLKPHNNIHIRLKIYCIMAYAYDLRNYLSNKINGYDTNFQINSNNCIYKFFGHNNYKINKFYTAIFKSKCSDIKIYDTNFININGYYGDSTYCKEFKHIIIDTNNINNIDKKKVKFYYDNNFIIKKTDVDKYIFDIYDDNYILYKNFIILFNNYDKHIIKIGSYGESGTGKTYFLKNILNIFYENDNLNNYLYHGNIHNFNIMFTKWLPSKINVAYIYNVFINYFGYEYIIYYINLDDPEIDQYIDIINTAINTIKFLHFKLIFFFSSTKYNKIYDNFDIVHKGTYITSEIKKNIEDKFLFKSKINKDNITINDLMFEILNNKYN